MVLGLGLALPARLQEQQRSRSLPKVHSNSAMASTELGVARCTAVERRAPECGPVATPTGPQLPAAAHSVKDQPRPEPVAAVPVYSHNSIKGSPPRSSGEQAGPSRSKRRHAGAAGPRPSSEAHSGKRAKLSSPGTRPAGRYSDLIGRTVEVPGAVFFVNTPGKYYVGVVSKAESNRKVESVEMRFKDDGSRYWFPVADVRGWVADMHRRCTFRRRNPDAPPLPPLPEEEGTAAAAQAADAEVQMAATALQEMSSSRGGSQATQSTAGRRRGEGEATSKGARARRQGSKLAR